MGGQVLCERRALSCMLCFVTGDLLREIEKPATLIRSESSCSPSIFFHLSVPPLHSASPLLVRTDLYKRLRLVYAHICASMFTCVVNGAHGWWGISSREARRCQMKQIGTFDSC